MITHAQSMEIHISPITTGTLINASINIPVDMMRPMAKKPGILTPTARMRPWSGISQVCLLWSSSNIHDPEPKTVASILLVVPSQRAPHLLNMDKESGRSSTRTCTERECYTDALASSDDSPRPRPGASLEELLFFV